MDEKMIKAILLALKKGDRVELIPVKDGVKMIRIRREEITFPRTLTQKASHDKIFS